MKFYKYQSLGNDFIIVEKKPNNIKELCDRNFGIGADGVMVITLNHIPEVEVFNSDGSKAEICLNGLRCTALHLVKYKNFPSEFKILMGKKLIECKVNNNITTVLPPAIYKGEKIINGYKGSYLLAPNPHFIIFHKCSLEWLKANGNAISTHPSFEHGTNVIFVWKSLDTYNTLSYERGCGVTLSCGSGALALITLLTDLSVDKSASITDLSVTDWSVKMPGGVIHGTLEKNIALKAKANYVFTGVIEDFPDIC